MSLCSTDPEFVFALRTKGDNRTERELNVIYSRLNRMEILSSMREQSLRGICTLVRYEKHDANEILYRKDDACRCWYILMSGSVFIQGSMFLPHACFGKQIPGTKRRGCQCLVLESSEMIAIDYPDMAIHSSGMPSRPHAMLRHDTGHHSPRGALDSVAEVDTSSAESSPLHQSRSNSMHKSSNGQIMVGGDNVSQFSKDTEEMDDYSEQDLEEEDSISLHSSSSIIIKDLVIDVLKKDISDRNGDDLEILLEFTKSLQAFSNLTEPIRRALCKVMVFAWVEKAGTVVLKDNELLDSWSVIINGNVQVRKDGTEEDVCLSMGDSFGVQPTLQPQQHNGVMYTMCDDCQFLCIAQPEYCQVLHQGQENIQNVYNEAGDLVMVKEKREFEGGTKIGNIVIRGNADSLMHHLLEENSIDTTYTEDFLLTYRAFNNDPLKISNKLLEWFDNVMFRDKVIRVILLWINNHFNDFECDWRMMNVLEKFEEKLHQANLHGQTKLFNIACTAKAQARTVTITRPSSEAELCFQILGGSEKNFPIYISSVLEGSEGETKGVKRGDLLLEVNGQNFEKLTLEKATAILKKNTELRLTLKTSLFAFKEMVSELSNPQKKKKHKTDEKNIFFPPGQRGGRMSLTMMSETDAFDQKHKKEAPEDVIKVYKADQTHKFLFVNRDTTAGDAVQSACKEFGITEDLKDYALYRVSVQGEKFVKQSKLPDPLSKLADIPLGSRYYLKNTMNSEQLLPDEQIPDLLKEANFSFLDLNCFEVAVFLTRKDYKMFQATASTDFIEDLFHLDAELTQFKAFEDLVNRELFWVVTTLCNEPNLIQRSKIIKHFVKIAHHCKILKNLNSTFALISGLGYRAVSRMKQTWEKVPAKSNRLFEELQALMDPSRNMSKYRTLLNEMVSQPPVIPYIPVIKKDLTFLDLGNDTKVEGLINFEKMRMIGKEVRNVCRLCAPDSTQILPSAAAQQRESEKGSQNPIYLTLARRGRRSSFNNVRRLYEDQINVRRVKQYMQSIEVVSDEDKLMEMSKAVESVIPSASNQQKRRNTTASLPSDSPSRSSKTLPAFPLRTSSNGSSSSLHSRNNSEPQLAAVPVIALHPTRKKMPVSSLPKFVHHQPPLIKVFAPEQDASPHSNRNIIKSDIQAKTGVRRWPPRHTRTLSGPEILHMHEKETKNAKTCSEVPPSGRNGRTSTRSILKSIRSRSRSLTKSFKEGNWSKPVKKPEIYEDNHVRVKKISILSQDDNLKLHENKSYDHELQNRNSDDFSLQNSCESLTSNISRKHHHDIYHEYDLPSCDRDSGFGDTGSSNSIIQNLLSSAENSPVFTSKPPISVKNQPKTTKRPENYSTNAPRKIQPIKLCAESNKNCIKQSDYNKRSESPVFVDLYRVSYTVPLPRHSTLSTVYYSCASSAGIKVKCAKIVPTPVEIGSALETWKTRRQSSSL